MMVCWQLSEHSSQRCTLPAMVQFQLHELRAIQIVKEKTKHASSMLIGKLHMGTKADQ
jgi:hypothetical protein